MPAYCQSRSVSAGARGGLRVWGLGVRQRGSAQLAWPAELQQVCEKVLSWPLQTKELQLQGVGVRGHVFGLKGPAGPWKQKCRKGVFVAVLDHGDAT